MQSRSYFQMMLTFTLLLSFLAACTPLTLAYQQTVTDQADFLASDTPIASQVVSSTLAKVHKTKQPQSQGTLSPKSTPASSTSSASSVAEATSDFNVILGRPTSDSVTVSLYSVKETQVVINYGTTSGNYTFQTTSVTLMAAKPQDVELTGLAADTGYYYRVVSPDGESDEYSFHTQRTPGDSFTFTIDADPHYSDPAFNGPLYETTLNNALSGHPDFHINLGDTFMTEKKNPQSINEDISAYVNMRSYLGILGADTPLFLVNGNHDGELGWLLSAQSMEPIWTTQLRQLYYPNPEPNGFYSGGSFPDPTLGTIRDTYYAWTWGDALFIVLDPFWYSTSKPDTEDTNSNWNYTLGKTQYDWLKTTLESSSAKYKFILIHNLVGGNDADSRGGIEAAPYFEWGGKNADGTYGFDQHRPGWGEPIHELLVQNHVSVVFHGHDHVFVKQDLDGIVYQEVPQSSITKYDNIGLAEQYGYTHGDVLSSSGHLLVTVMPYQATIEYIRAFLPQDQNSTQQNGEVAYQYSIK